MKVIAISLLGLLLLLVVSTCYYDSEEYLFPQTGGECDTLNVTYTVSVEPILQNHCLSCHANSVAASFGGNIRLEEYADVKVQADNHKLLGAVDHENGYTPMPMGAPKLDNCKVTTIRIWVNAGAPN